jgi:Holliday junction resolvase-like predicted endonuclease
MLSRFCEYIDKVFDFGEMVKTILDSRERPQISVSSVWSSTFFMFAARLGSLNAIESELRIPKRMDGFVGKKKPSADTIGRVYSHIDVEKQRKILSGINHRLKRNKVLKNDWPLRFVAIDGHEFFSQQTPEL